MIVHRGAQPRAKKPPSPAGEAPLKAPRTGVDDVEFGPLFEGKAVADLAWDFDLENRSLLEVFIERNRTGIRAIVDSGWPRAQDRQRGKVP